MDRLAVTTACLEAEYPPETTAAMLALADDHSTLAAAFAAWHADSGEFCEAVETILGDACTFCEDCGFAEWVDDVTWTGDETAVCEECLERYASCENCDSWHRTNDMVNVDSDYYCERCRDRVLWYCDPCDEWFHQDDSCDHDDDDDDVCDCEAPRFRFTFPANGAGEIAQDERLAVHLPRGEVDEVGLLAIKRLVAASDLTCSGDLVHDALDSIGPVWQTKRGNFTRRLSSALHKAGIKVAPGVLSEVGNLARAHSSGETSWMVEMTRDLNQSASDFYHGDSCWWGATSSYGGSRCCLKHWGGLGMRTYADADTPSYRPSGRAWVQPLGADLTPTHDTIGARAYVVYNGYGELEGYTAARIIAYLTGRTYRKITLDIGGQFVNGSTGYLVGDEDDCESHDRISYAYDSHDYRDARDARTFDRKETAA